MSKQQDRLLWEIPLITVAAVCSLLLVINLRNLRTALLANLTSVARMHQAFYGASPNRQHQINAICSQVGPLYSQHQYGEIVALALPVWQDTPEIDLRVSSCRQYAIELAVSLQLSGKTNEMELVYHKVVELWPGSQDTEAYFAWLGLGDLAVQRENWIDAARFFASANQIALVLPASNREINRLRIWKRMDGLVLSFENQAPLVDFIALVDPASSSSGDSQGLWILVGLAYERLHRYPESVTAFQSALDLAPGDAYLASYLEKVKIQATESVP